MRRSSFAGLLAFCSLLVTRALVLVLLVVALLRPWPWPSSAAAPSTKSFGRPWSVAIFLCYHWPHLCFWSHIRFVVLQILCMPTRARIHECARNPRTAWMGRAQGGTMLPVNIHMLILCPYLCCTVFQLNVVSFRIPSWVTTSKVLVQDLQSTSEAIVGQAILSTAH